MKKQIHGVIYGYIQGVFFRVFIKDKADELDLVGWVRNEADGTVQMVAQGEEENLKKLIGYCKEGPRFAKIDKVEIKWEQATGQFCDFRIK